MRTSHPAARGLALRRRRGLSIIYMVILLFALAAIVSLAVDFGRIRLARAQLQTAADASARSGAYSLPVSQTAVTNSALDAAANNFAIDADDTNGKRTNPGVSLDVDDDIAVGWWDVNTRRFTVLSDKSGTSKQDERRGANAVRTHARRLASRNDPVPLVVAPIVGVFSSDIDREAIAYIHNGPKNFGFVGLDWVKSNGNYTSIDSVTPPSTTRHNGGSVASNGNVDLGNGDVYGDVRAGINKQILHQPNSIITGWTANLDYSLSYPVVDSIPTNHPAVTNVGITPRVLVDMSSGALIATSQTGKVDSGTGTPRNYYFTGWTDHGGGNITVYGPTTIYIDGNWVMDGTSKLTIDSSKGAVKFIVNGSFTQNAGTISSSPGGLYISVIKANTSVVLTGNAVATSAHVYAPLSDVTINGTPGFTGWIVGKTLTFKGTSKLHYDESGTDKTAYKISLVR